MRWFCLIALLPAMTPCAAQHADDDSVYSPERLAAPPAVLAVPQFHYPPALALRRPHGRLMLRFVVDTFGRVEPASISILEAPDSALVGAAREFALQVLFRPGEAHGHRVRVLVELPVNVEAGAGAPPEEPLPLDSVRVKPALLSISRPRYPVQAANAGVEGVVETEAVLDTTGQVEDSTLSIIRSPGPEFSAEALRVMRTARYRPARGASRCPLW